MEIRVTVEGLDVAERRLVQLIAGITDLRMFWPRLVPIFIGWMRETFDSEGAWAGNHWAPLSPAYAAWKSQRYPGKGILIAAGDLRKAASSPTRRVTPTTLELVIENEIAAFHQAGTPRMPARPILPAVMPLAAQAEVKAAADEYVRDLATRLGLR